jgi:hypothetical protein
MNIAWSSVTGASGYNVYRGKRQGQRRAGRRNELHRHWPDRSNYLQLDRERQSTHRAWRARCRQPQPARRQGSLPPPPTCTTASNYAHTQAGRAHQSGGYAYANGSNQNMGLWNLFTTTTLKQTGPTTT